MRKISEIIQDYLAWAPISLTIREVSRIKAFQELVAIYNLNASDNVLDVGCGDGRWWKYLNILELKKVTGIDISAKEVSLASHLFSAYCLDIANTDFSEKLTKTDFDLVIGNCSLEHIFDIEMALKNIYQKTAEEGLFILFVPAPLWAMKGKSVAFLNKLSPRMAMSFSGLINGFFQHWHLYNYKIWKSLLQTTGFEILNVYGLGNKRAEFLFRLFLPTSFISFIFKIMTSKYLNTVLNIITPNFIKNRIAKMIENSLDQKLHSADDDDIFEYIIVCKK